MADLADVEKGMVAAIAAILFSGPYNSGDFQNSLAFAPWPPATTANPTPTPVATPIKLYRGWPEENMLDADLALGKAHVSVFAEQGMTQIIDRYFPTFEQVSIASPTLSWTVSGNTATLSGTITTPQNIAVIINGLGFSYAVQTGDTLATAVAALAALIALPGTSPFSSDFDSDFGGGISASVSGTTITVPTAHELVARVGTFGVMAAEVGRVNQGIRVSVWAASARARDVIAGMIDTGLRGLFDAFGNLTQFITLDDGTAAQVQYRTTYIDDKPTKDRVWRRDLCYMVQYATFVEITAPEFIVPIATEQLSARGLCGLYAHRPSDDYHISELGSKTWHGT